MTTDDAAQGHAAIPITGVPEADELLVDNPLALLIGMLMDQQVPMGWAFRGPFTLQERLGGSLDAETIAAMGPDKIEAIFRDSDVPAKWAHFIQVNAERVAQLKNHVGHITDKIEPKEGPGCSGRRSV